MFSQQRAQAFLEYVMVITIIVMAVMTLMPMLRRGSQSLVKVAADQIGDQVNSEQDFNAAHLVRSTTTSHVGGGTQTSAQAGVMKEIMNETTRGRTRSELLMDTVEAEK